MGNFTADDIANIQVVVFISILVLVLVPLLLFNLVLITLSAVLLLVWFILTKVLTLCSAFFRGRTHVRAGPVCHCTSYMRIRDTLTCLE